MGKQGKEGGEEKRGEEKRSGGREEEWGRVGEGSGGEGGEAAYLPALEALSTRGSPINSESFHLFSSQVCRLVGLDGRDHFGTM